ncbi:hypothetical protein GGR43_000035 [Sphingobium jiangsuense]|uniref:Uncharacterized protein n=1 Tax=Sphingobium jiangsuense TaxID=870476 RepID=A0A7W6FMS5_9SPHN|nr:hypothetical protein [Sphingobium jiangsuense]MBB3924341.1 hypothetical protein [Sphingobium jiangsuense]
MPNIGIFRQLLANIISLFSASPTENGGNPPLPEIGTPHATSWA